MGLSMFFAIFFVSLFAGVPTSSAWGADGHYMICKIAQGYLTSTASNAVLNLLPPQANGDLASECSWADVVRGAYPWSSPLHYIDTPDNLCTYDYTRDCHDSSGTAGFCVAGAVNNYTAQLRTYPSTTFTDPSKLDHTCNIPNHNAAYSWYDNLTQALMFLSHFMGDIHQPLHVGFTTDLGGNTITVYWYNVKTNLHSTWDTKIIQTSMSKYYANDKNTMANSIQANITSTQISQWNSCGGSTTACTDTFASEGIQQACNYAYKDVSQNSYLSDTYYSSRSSVVNTRIAQGAVRLANFLNQIFV